jgi:hypothetical protein
VIFLAKISVEGIVAILLYLGLITAKAEGLKKVFGFIVAIAILAFIAGFAWWFI